MKIAEKRRTLKCEYRAKLLDNERLITSVTTRH